MLKHEFPKQKKHLTLYENLYAPYQSSTKKRRVDDKAEDEFAGKSRQWLVARLQQLLGEKKAKRSMRLCISICLSIYSYVAPNFVGRRAPLPLSEFSAGPSGRLWAEHFQTVFGDVIWASIAEQSKTRVRC